MNRQIETLESRRLMSGTPDVTVVMTGLDSPRGLDFDDRGALYVAEAGKGGGVGAPSVLLRGTPFYYGTTGAVSRLWHGHQKRVVTGLPSLAMADGSRGTGPADIAIGDDDEKAYIPIGFEGDPAVRQQLGDLGKGFAQLVQVKPNGKWSYAADLGTYEINSNPDPRMVDSNPYSVLAGKKSQVVVDAGGNSLLRVDKKGNISTLAVLPLLDASQAFSRDPVPTSIVEGPDGAYYVGILSGAPFRDGAANIYRIVPGQTPTVHLSGLKTVIDLDFDRHGNLYVLQHSSGPAGLAGAGSLLRIAPDGTRTTVIDGLNQPTSVAVSENGKDLYVSINGLSPGIGQVIKVKAPRIERDRDCRDRDRRSDQCLRASDSADELFDESSDREALI